MPQISQDQFSVMLAEFRTAFRLEHQRDPLPGEQEALQHWLSGNLMVQDAKLLIHVQEARGETCLVVLHDTARASQRI